MHLVFMLIGLFLGRGKRANVLLSLDRDISCFSMMGMLNEPFDKVYLAVEDCQALATQLQGKLKAQGQ
ncbi:hypothetical protein AB6T38_15120 [Aliiglaciecola sp. SL4]|uniref:hypothetical protein n=1 Tax=Aliiglaciecola sp. SL4 TaxID=3239806 RepID=UPI00355C658C